MSKGSFDVGGNLEVLRKSHVDNMNHHFIKRIILTVLAVCLMSVTVHADEADQLSTVYHVYVDQDYIGQVDDQAVVQTIIDAKLEKGKQEFENVNIVIGESISYIQEKVFNPKYNNENVKNELEETLTIKTEAVALHIDGDIVGHFKDKETAEKVIESYKAKFVSEDVLKALDVDKQGDNEEPQELELGDSLIEEVKLSKDITFSEEKANPDDILDHKQGVKLLEKGTIEEKVHKVQEGDVLGGIASQYDLTVDQLLDLNPSLEEDSLLQIDQEIHVTEPKPLVDVVVKEQKKVEEKVPHETEILESKEMYEGEEKVKQKGDHGTKEVLYKLEIVNDQVAEKEIVEEKVTKEPTKEIVMKGTKVIPSRGTGHLAWPAIGGYVSSYKGERWGRQHKGIDIARPSNRAILAADHGVVTSAGYNSGGYGNKIEINHNNGMKTIYAHLDSISVKPGQKVEKGMEIGVMGSTGRSTGVHLHFEVYKNGKLKDPMSYLK